MGLVIHSNELGDFGTNCYIIACTETGECAVVDPGVPDSWVAETVAANGLKPVAILLTHGHLDHIGGVAAVKAATGAPVAVHGDDAPMLTDVILNGSATFGLRITAPRPDRLLQDGDRVVVGQLQLQVLHTPGHTPGGVCYYMSSTNGEGPHLIAGDTLFAGSVGRTDLPGGDHKALIAGIHRQLLSLPPETIVYPGHGPTTTIGDEKEYNPYL
ncbi:MAG: MBL fold metallo-hydrolase [Mycobacterium leprae]